MFLSVSIIFSLFGIFTCVCMQGFGMLLMEEAERIAKEEHGSSKIAVISGICQSKLYPALRMDVNVTVYFILGLK